MDSVPASLGDDAASLPVIEPSTLADDALIIDVRDAADWRAGHAPGAVNVPISQLAARLDEVVAIAREAGMPVAVSCGGGTKQGRATAYLLANGVDAQVMRGGMRGWTSAGRPVLTES